MKPAGKGKTPVAAAFGAILGMAVDMGAAASDESRPKADGTMLSEDVAQGDPAAGYSRDNPSPSYRELLEVYAQAHAGGLPGQEMAAEEVFDGNSLLGHVDRIKRLVETTGAKSVLDFGSGKGRHYFERDIPVGKTVIPSIREYWGVGDIRLYDPGVEQFSEYPGTGADGVICTDVLEHIPEDDVYWFLRDLFGLAAKFLYVNIAGYPAQKILPNGWNAHVTVKDIGWWRERIARAAQGWTGMHYTFVYERKLGGMLGYLRKKTAGNRLVEKLIADVDVRSA